MIEKMSFRGYRKKLLHSVWMHVCFSFLAKYEYFNTYTHMQTFEYKTNIHILSPCRHFLVFHMRRRRSVWCGSCHRSQLFVGRVFGKSLSIHFLCVCAFLAMSCVTHRTFCIQTRRKCKVGLSNVRDREIWLFVRPSSNSAKTFTLSLFLLAKRVDAHSQFLSF